MVSVVYPLDKFRAETGRTQQQVAWQLGVALSTVARWEKLGRMPRAQRDQLCRAAAFDTPLEAHRRLIEQVKEFTSGFETRVGEVSPPAKMLEVIREHIDTFLAAWPMILPR